MLFFWTVVHWFFCWKNMCVNVCGKLVVENYTKNDREKRIDQNKSDGNCTRVFVSQIYFVHKPFLFYRRRQHFIKLILCPKALPHLLCHQMTAARQLQTLTRNKESTTGGVWCLGPCKQGPWSKRVTMWHSQTSLGSGTPPPWKNQWVTVEILCNSRQPDKQTWANPSGEVCCETCPLCWVFVWNSSIWTFGMKPIRLDLFELAGLKPIWTHPTE